MLFTLMESSSDAPRTDLALPLGRERELHKINQSCQDNINEPLPDRAPHTLHVIIRIRTKYIKIMSHRGHTKGTTHGSSSST
jgi:hypothetical protein